IANNAAESESFPEGLAQMLLEDYLSRHLAIPPDQSARFRAELTPPERKENYEKALESLRDTEDIIKMGHPQAGHNSEKHLYAWVDFTAIDLGYGKPSTPEQVRRI